MQPPGMRLQRLVLGQQLPSLPAACAHLRTRHSHGNCQFASNWDGWTLCEPICKSILARGLLAENLRKPRIELDSFWSLKIVTHLDPLDL